MLVKKNIINYRIDADSKKLLNVLRAHPHLLVSPRQQNLIFRLDNSQCAYSFYEIYSIIKCIYYFAFCRKRNYFTNAQYTEYKYLYSERTVEFSFGSALATRGIVIWYANINTPCFDRNRPRFGGKINDNFNHLVTEINEIWICFEGIIVSTSQTVIEFSHYRKNSTENLINIYKLVKVFIRTDYNLNKIKKIYFH